MSWQIIISQSKIGYTQENKKNRLCGERERERERERESDGTVNPIKIEYIKVIQKKYKGKFNWWE